MYPEDPRARKKQPTSLKEQVLLVLMAVGIAVAVSGLAGAFLYLARVWRGP